MKQEGNKMSTFALFIWCEDKIILFVLLVMWIVSHALFHVEQSRIFCTIRGPLDVVRGTYLFSSAFK